MKKIFAILIALSALSNFSCKEKEEEYTEGGLVFGGIYMLDGQQLVETDGYILELPAEQNTVELRIVSKGVQEFGIGGYPMSGLGEYKVEGFTIKVTPDPASEKLEIYDYIDVEYKGEQHRVPRYLQTLHLGADTNTGQQKEIRIRFITNIPNYWMEWSQLTVRQAGRQRKKEPYDSFFHAANRSFPTFSSNLFSVFSPRQSPRKRSSAPALTKPALTAARCRSDRPGGRRHRPRRGRFRP